MPEGQKTMRSILAADIGGTNARFAFFVLKNGNLSLEKVVWLNTSDYLTECDLARALPEAGIDLSVALAGFVAMAVAGPLINADEARLTNTGLCIDMARLRGTFNVPATLLMNDFAAQAYACITPLADMAEHLFGKAETVTADGLEVKAVVGAGTGFGAAFLTGGNNLWKAVPTEFGHNAFSFVGAEEMRLQNFVCRKLDQPYALLEDIVSGRGLSLMHEFLTGNELAPAQVAKEALAAPSPTLSLFARLYARACRNFALTSLCRSGLYIAGGIAARNPLVVRCREFQDEFTGSLAYKDLIRSIPVRLISDENSGLWGAAQAALLEQFSFEKV
jgi:glucokinase